jgi:cytochrome P450
MTASDFDDYFLLPVVAGDETTRHTISQSMLALSENQDQLRILQERPGLINSAVEEFLRWASPFTSGAPRPATSNSASQKDNKVFMWFASAPGRSVSIHTAT